MPAVSSIAIGAVLAGTALSVAGNIKANHAQAKAEHENAMFLQEQAQFAKLATDREVDIYRDQANEFFGNQVTGFSRGGVELTGSPLLVLADTKSRAKKEEAAIIADGAAKVREATLKGQLSEKTANRLGGFSNNFLPAAGASLTGLSQAVAMKADSKRKTT